MTLIVAKIGIVVWSVKQQRTTGLNGLRAKCCLTGFAVPRSFCVYKLLLQVSVKIKIAIYMHFSLDHLDDTLEAGSFRPSLIRAAYRKNVSV